MGSRKQDKSDAEEIHDLVEDINLQQTVSGQQTTIPESVPADTEKL